MIQQKFVGFFIGSLVALILISFKGHAASPTGADWGDLGYAQAIDPEVESIPSTDEELMQRESLEMAPAQEVAEVKIEPLPPEPAKPAPGPKRDFTKISTVQNTYGVMTEEQAPIRFYVSPMAGFGSVLGTDAATVLPRYAVGGSVGFLISDNIRLEGTYAYQEQEFSNLRINALGGVLPFGFGPTLALKQNAWSGGAKLFVLGRESRFRPYLGGGLQWTRGTLNYTPMNLQVLSGQPQFNTDFTLNQFGGFGELGTEIAITRAIVAQLSFKLAGVITSSTSNDRSVNFGIDPGKSDVGNSVSRSASYLLGAGLGIYF
jgi:outer membrane protein W